MGPRAARPAMAPSLASIMVVLLLLLATAAPCRATVVQVNAGELFTITELLPAGHIALVGFQLHPDFLLPVRVRTSPDNAELQKWGNEERGVVEIASSDKNRDIALEFDNSDSILTSKNVFFYITTVPDAERDVKTSQVDPIERRIQTLYTKMHALRGLQQSLRYQQKNHRATVEDVNERVLLWSVVQLIGFFVVAGGHLLLLRHFLEKRRTV